MKLEHFILGLLKLKPRTGYDLKKYLDSEGRFARPRTPLSQIYNTLKRMTEKGWLTFESEAQDGKPDRKIYSVTPEGDKYFMTWLEQPHEPSFRFQDRKFLGKLLFSCFLDDETILEHLRAELAYREENIAKFRSRDRTVEIDPSSGVDPKRAQAFADLQHEYGAGAVDHYITWIKQVIEFLENKV